MSVQETSCKRYAGPTLADGQCMDLSYDENNISNITRAGTGVGCKSMLTLQPSRPHKDNKS